jgi:gliding motility-associated-like protein
MKLLALLSLLLISLQDHAQNLIPNAGFENVRTPKKSKYPGSIEKAYPWFSPGNGSPDLIQNNAGAFGRQNAADGRNYAGIILYDHENPNFREYLGVKLSKQLKPGVEYCVQFKVSAADETWAYTDELGVYIGADSIATQNWAPIQVGPQFRTRKYLTISDTAGWKHLEFTYVATGNEQYVYVGNFRTDASTLIQPANRGAWSKTVYIYLDAFELQSCVPEDPVSSPEPLRVLKETEEPRAPVIPTMLSPNGDGFNDVFVIANLKRYSTLVVYNKKGEQVYQTGNYANDFDGKDLPDGKYSFELKTPEGNIIFGSFDLMRDGKRKS